MSLPRIKLSGADHGLSCLALPSLALSYPVWPDLAFSEWSGLAWPGLDWPTRRPYLLQTILCQGKPGQSSQTITHQTRPSQTWPGQFYSRQQPLICWALVFGSARPGQAILGHAIPYKARHGQANLGLSQPPDWTGLGWAGLSSGFLDENVVLLGKEAQFKFMTWVEFWLCQDLVYIGSRLSQECCKIWERIIGSQWWFDID